MVGHGRLLERSLGRPLPGGALILHELISMLEDVGDDCGNNSRVHARPRQQVGVQREGVDVFRLAGERARRDDSAGDSGGQSAWQRSKEYSDQALEKSKELYESAKAKGSEVGLRVKSRVRHGDKVYKVS